ncbi:MAG TPA: hypothetical protein VIS49_09490 [Cyclobacteriaceae bacterium]
MNKSIKTKKLLLIRISCGVGDLWLHRHNDFVSLFPSGWWFFLQYPHADRHKQQGINDGTFPDLMQPKPKSNAGHKGCIRFRYLQ